MSDLGPLAAALAKARVGFKTVKRDKTVKVETKTGGSYSFKYAPLEAVLDAVLDPLSANGLALVQILDDGDIVTSLIHESGAILTGRYPLPTDTDIKGLGSAITYLRRYAVQALLGIAAEDDDDGNRATGDRVVDSDAPAPVRPQARGETETFLGVLKKWQVGVIRKGGSEQHQLTVRETPDGPGFGFRLELNDRDESGAAKAIPQVVVPPDIAVPLLAHIGGDPAVLEKQTVQVKGQLFAVTAPGRKSYHRLLVREWKDDERMLPPEEPPAEALPETGLFSTDEQAAIDAAVEAVG